MIVFTHDPNLIQYLQPQNWHQRLPSLVFNLSSLYSGYIDITQLAVGAQMTNYEGIPSSQYVNTVEFDQRYAGVLMNNPIFFCKFMSVVSHSYEGGISIVLVERDMYRDAIMESIIKFIQQRYGHQCWIVEDIEDLACIHADEFSLSGLTALQQDLDNYYRLNPQSGAVCVE